MNLFQRKFWGVVLVLFGIGLLLERLFGISFNFWGIFWSLVIVFLGLNIAFGEKNKEECCSRLTDTKDGNIIFNDSANVEVDGKKGEYNIIFSQGQIDLSKIKIEGKNVYLKVNNIFASGSLKLDPKMPIKISASCAFGEVKSPDKREISFGEMEYMTKSYSPDKPYLFVRISTVFGALEIIEK
jgi:predicted membrane protein